MDVGRSMKESTLEEYKRTMSRIFSYEGEDRIAYMQRTKSRSAHNKNLAALRLYENHYLKKGETDNAKQLSELAELKPASYSKRQSKSRVELKTGWREILINRTVESASPHKKEILVSIITGLRPSEFNDGVRIIVDSNQVKFTIKGAKTKLNDKTGKLEQGMPWRSLSFDLPSNDQALMELLKMLKKENPLDNMYEIALESSVGGFSAALKRMGCGLVKTRGKSFSAYNLRHAFATLLKSSGCNDVDISRALGHISMKTKGYYGRTKTTTTGISPDKITSSHTPRPYSRNHPSMTKSNRSNPNFKI